MDSCSYGLTSTDLAFIQKKVEDSEWWEVDGAINAVTNTIEFIPASGKTAFIFRAKIQITGHTQAALRTSGSGSTVVLNAVEASLKVDGVEKDRTNMGMISRSDIAAGLNNTESVQYGNLGDGKFNAVGLFLVGDGVKKITIENVTDNGSAHATMSGWLSDT